jgi:hypothetical protein
LIIDRTKHRFMLCELPSFAVFVIHKRLHGVTALAFDPLPRARRCPLLPLGP